MEQHECEMIEAAVEVAAAAALAFASSRPADGLLHSQKLRDILEEIMRYDAKKQRHAESSRHIDPAPEGSGRLEPDDDVPVRRVEGVPRETPPSTREAQILAPSTVHRLLVSKRRAFTPKRSKRRRK